MTEVAAVPKTAFVVASEVHEPSTEVAVYRPQLVELAQRMDQVAQTIDKRLAPLASKQKQVKVITDWWGVPLLAGAAGALGLGLLTEVAAIVPWLVASAGAAASTVGALVHPKLRSKAVEQAPPLLQGELRTQVLGLETASRDFAPSEGGRVEAPQLQAFVATKAQALLKQATERGVTTNDPDLRRVLERLAGTTTELTADEKKVLEFTEMCLSAGQHYDFGRGIPAAFAALSDAEKVEVAPFVRDRLFDADGFKFAAYNDEAHMDLHRALEAIEPTIKVPFATKPDTIPAPAAPRDIVKSLGTLAEFEERLSHGQGRPSDRSKGPDAVAKAVAFAIEPHHGGVERALFGIMAQRELEGLRGPSFRVRAALRDLVATAAAEPQSIRDQADAIMKRVDLLSEALYSQDHYNRVEIPGLALRKVIAMLELARMN